MSIALEIIDPWIKGDPCADCAECDKVCRKLVERIEERFENLLGLPDFPPIVPDQIAESAPWDCPLGHPDCKKNCGDYGCGN